MKLNKSGGLGYKKHIEAMDKNNLFIPSLRSYDQE